MSPFSIWQVLNRLVKHSDCGMVGVRLGSVYLFPFGEALRKDRGCSAEKGTTEYNFQKIGSSMRKKAGFVPVAKCDRCDKDATHWMDVGLRCKACGQRDKWYSRAYEAQALKFHGWSSHASCPGSCAQSCWDRSNRPVPRRS